ncbi:MAG: nucleotide pyrophosphohydrolase [Thermoplasmataceae archaeon]
MLDETTTLSKLKQSVREFCREREWDRFHTPKELAIGMVTESSELLQLFRFKSDMESTAAIHEENEGRKIRDEIADTLYFVVRFAQLYDIDLSAAFTEKMNLNKEKYPVESSKGSNKRYNEM